MAEARAHIFVSGRVQGVFFRSNTRKKARGLGINGFVKNLEDGRVEIVAEGEKEKLEQLINWANTGSPAARVRNVEVNWKEYTGKFDSFEIKY